MTTQLTEAQESYNQKMAETVQDLRDKGLLTEAPDMSLETYKGGWVNLYQRKDGGWDNAQYKHPNEQEAFEAAEEMCTKP